VASALAAALPPDQQGLPEPREEPDVWLRIRAGDHGFEHRVAKPGFRLDDAAELA
jgi:hypothetical protein